MMFVKTAVLSLVLATVRASTPLVPVDCEDFRCKHDGGGLMYVTKRHFGGASMECSCERYFSDPKSPCYDQECLGEGELIVEDDRDGTCSCERPCDDQTCGDGPDDKRWVPVIDYNRIGGKSNCVCADKVVYAAQLKLTQANKTRQEL